MKKEEFLKELEYLLSDLPEDERKEAVGYYRDYFDEAGPQNEEELVGQMGGPEKAAAEIRAGLSGSSRGEFTERGYQDAQFWEAYHVPDQYAQIVTADKKAGEDSGSRDAKDGESEQDSGDSGWTSFERQGKSCREEWSKWRREREKRFESARRQNPGRQRQRSGRTGESREQRSGRAEERRERWQDRRDGENRGLMIFLLVIFFGLPAAGSVIGAGFSVVGGILGGIFGILGGVFGLAAAAVAGTIGSFGAGISLIFSGVSDFSTPAVSLMSIGGGFLLLALAMLLLLLTRWVCGTAVPWMIRLLRDIIRAGAGWIRELLDGIFGNRGERL